MLRMEHNFAPQKPKEYLEVAIARRPSYGNFSQPRLFWLGYAPMLTLGPSVPQYAVHKEPRKVPTTIAAAD